MATTRESYYVQSFGRDCMGNISGYAVYERGTGIAVEHFYGNVYEPGSFDTARKQAEQEAKALTVSAIKEHRG